MAQVTGGGDGEIRDAVVIGGSFAGISAALYLARGRRQVTVVDEGLTRNRFAAHGHGLLGHDGRPPAEIQAAGISDLLAYPEARMVQDRVVAVAGQADDFRVTLATGRVLRARRLVLAYGTRDILPDLPGLAAIWGRTAFQCPYCHGYEMAGRPAALWFAAPGVAEHARFLQQWVPDLTVATDGAPLPEADAAALQAAGIAVETARLTAVESDGDALRGLFLADGRRLAVEVLYMVPRNEPACDLAAQLGCRMAEGRQGPIVETSQMQETSVPGVFAAGDLDRPVFGAAFALAEGVMAGTACHRSLVMGL